MGYGLCMPAMATLVYGPPLPAAAVGALTFLAGFGGAAQISCFALIRELNPPALSGTAIGVVNAFVTAAGAFYQPLIGLILDRVWSGGVVEGARVYAATDFRIGFSVLMVGMLVGLFCTLAMRETYCKQVA